MTRRDYMVLTRFKRIKDVNEVQILVLVRTNRIPDIILTM